MNLRQRFAELIAIITKDIPEREYYVQLGFLTALIQEPFYLYGRPGCGSSLFIRRISSAFKDAKVLKLGKKQRQLPDNINDFNLIIFDNFTPGDEQSKNNLQIVIHDHEKNSIIISGDQKPESALSRSEVSDQVTLTIMLPDNISSDALCKLLQLHGTDSNVTVPPSLAISAEEQAQWIQAISKVTLSPNTLAVIGKVAETCEKNCVYVPIRRWLALSNMIKAIAFLNGRAETKLIDTFFLGTSIWGRSASNSAISESYREILKAQLYKNTPSLLETPYDANDLLMRVNHLVHSSNNLYETKPFNGEKCLAYRITIAGESVPLYAPLKYIETDINFNPYNELRQIEKRVVCNYHGTSNCTISIDPQVRTSGLRSSVNQANTPCTKFEEFGTLPTYILRENAPEIIEEKKVLRDKLNEEIKESMDRETANLVALRNTYKLFNESKDDLFCFTQMFNAVQDDIKAQFDNTANIIKTIKKASETIASLPSNMLKIPNLVGKQQAKPQAPQASQPAQPSPTTAK
jgi:MoxR-like ATPase